MHQLPLRGLKDPAAAALLALRGHFRTGGGCTLFVQGGPIVWLVQDEKSCPIIAHSLDLEWVRSVRGPHRPNGRWVILLEKARGSWG